ncbi:MAG TPA: amidohydrolase [Gammaproteobacteria bacterium]|nr:amidohydrolase [Gammaproteobacteria bacterium]
MKICPVWLKAGLVALAVATLPPAHAASQKASLVLRHGKIVTLWPEKPTTQAIAVADHKVLAVGSDADIAVYIGSDTRVIDLNGRLAVPGFIEGHGHFMELGQSKMELDLTTAKTWSDIVAMVKKAAATAEPGEWIVGRGWHQEKWTRPPQPNIDGLPLGDKLNAVSPNNPVVLIHASGHAVFANVKALEIAGISKNTPDPKGGEIVRKRDGTPIGMLRDNAQDSVLRALQQWLAKRPPAKIKADRMKAIRLAGHDALSKGITTFVDMGEPFDIIDVYKALAQKGKLPLRLYAMINSEPPEALANHIADYRMIDYGEHGFLTVRGIGEILSDGALGTHSAWFLKPYNDLPSSTGINVTPMKRIHRIAEIAINNDFQLAVHAIGDRANREVLDVYEEIFNSHPKKTDLRWRIEHAQHLNPEDIPRFGEMHVIASMQSIHACSDGPYVVKRIGKKRAKEGAYAWQSLLKTGAMLNQGTDVPVEDEDPIPNFKCAVTRQLKDGSLFFPEQDMSRMQALKSYTLWNAYGMFKAKQLGSLMPGKLADIVVLSKDIMTVEPAGIDDAKVDYTILNGNVVYQREENQHPSSRPSSYKDLP